MDEHYQKYKSYYNRKNREWKAANPQAITSGTPPSKWKEQNPEGYAMWAKRQYAHKKDLRKLVIAKLGGRCANLNCGWVNQDGTRGCTVFNCLQIDHVQGGGCQERRILKANSVRFYKQVLADTEGRYQLLCANCNWLKHVLPPNVTESSEVVALEPTVLVADITRDVVKE